MMKFSDYTVTVLKNFATINPSIVLRPGNQLITVTQGQSITAQATITEQIPEEAGIFDLSKFLAVYALHNNPTIQFNGNHFVIADNNRRTKLTYTDKTMLNVTFPKKIATLPDPIASFTLKWVELQSAIKGASILRLPELNIRADEQTVTISAVDSEVPNADTYQVDVGTCDGQPFNITVSTENIRVIPSDYTVDVYPHFVRFATDGLQYYIAGTAKQ